MIERIDRNFLPYVQKNFWSIVKHMWAKYACAVIKCYHLISSLLKLITWECICCVRENTTEQKSASSCLALLSYGTCIFWWEWVGCCPIFSAWALSAHFYLSLFLSHCPLWGQIGFLGSREEKETLFIWGPTLLSLFCSPFMSLAPPSLTPSPPPI